MSGSFQDDYTDSFGANSIPAARRQLSGGDTGVKRRRLSNSGMDSDLEGGVIRGRTFLPIRGGDYVYCTEEWKSSGTSLFLPVTTDRYVNLTKYDQITAAQGSFFTADDTGSFQRSLIGRVLHLWRYDKQERKMYIALSFLFSNNQEFLDVQSVLQNA